MAEQLYAVYPGTVSTYDEDGYSAGDITWTAADLAAAYGVQNDNYLVVNNPLQVPQGLDYFNYIHLKPRADNKYQNIKYTSEDDDQDVAYRPDFDGTKRYIQETDRNNIESDVDFPRNKRDN